MNLDYSNILLSSLSILLTIIIMVQQKTQKSLDFNTKDSKDILKTSESEKITFILLMSVFGILSIDYLKNL